MRGVLYYNFPAFDAMKKRLTKMRWKVISPADLDRKAGFDAMKLPVDTNWFLNPKHFSLRNCVKRDVKAIISCDAMAILPGWEKSTGVKAEKALADCLCIPVYDAKTMKPIGGKKK